ncbi:SufD family Fe-S cluster assembly protein [Lacticaseibacillus baoqingensis]|uniref:SufD family Fe-S cluster assembly protein n=1 Tax=Lacticaseibacillus baoqingensis TaxID=2486013 RepID=A0ABW4E564_9LACO|nr:SufD family Fe-S cluster assembly protein [Lacticaseibacillus baoqingensis]
MPETLTLPNAPKIPLRRYLKQTKDDALVAPATVDAPSTVVVDHPDSVVMPATNDFEKWLNAKPQSVTTINIPAGFSDQTPIKLTGPVDGGGLVHITIGENANVVFQERWTSTGSMLGIAVAIDIAAGATVNWLAYDAFKADTVLLQRTVNMAANTTLNLTVAGFSQNSGASLLTTNLNGDGAEATINVGVLAAGKQHLGYATAVTNFGRKTVGHINQRGVITDKAHLVFNGIGHIVEGARGSDAQQENRVLMLSEHARGDANPILLIDENDVTAGHAASASRVDQRQLYYLMSRGVSAVVAKRMVIRGFLEAGLGEIRDADLKQELFDAIDETLVNADA